MAEMSAADAETYIVSGVLGAPAGAPWRWTLQRAELNFELDRTDGWKLVADFVIPDSTFRDTGPVTVSFFINGRLLERVFCASPGKQRLEKPAPPEWLSADGVTSVVAEVDRPWVSPNDGARLGMILSRVGLAR